MVLWRYMTLDKLVNLLDEKAIFFAPLSFYQRSDPYEGYPPAIAMKSIYNTYSARFKEYEGLLAEIENNNCELNDDQRRRAGLVRQLLDSKSSTFRSIVDKIFKGSVVSCWYQASHQSEAMWKLYGDQHKGVAIKTSAKLLAEQLGHAQTTPRQSKIFIGKVRYIDYSDENLKPSDCLVDGHIIPLSKRVSYQHENEVRAFMAADMDPASPETFEAKPFYANCDVSALIEAVYVSPYAPKSYYRAVESVVRIYGLNCPVEQSDLLTGAERLFIFD